MSDVSVSTLRVGHVQTDVHLSISFILSGNGGSSEEPAWILFSCWEDTVCPSTLPPTSPTDHRMTMLGVSAPPGLFIEKMEKTRTFTNHSSLKFDHLELVPGATQPLLARTLLPLLWTESPATGGNFR